MKRSILLVFIVLTIPSECVERNRISLHCEDDYEMKNPLTVTVASSVKECGVQCFSSSSCYTFSYRQTTKQCLHDGNKFRHDDLVTVAKGSVYCATSDKVLVMSNDQKPWFDPELCPTGMETAKQSQLEEANEQGLHHCVWGWVDESNNPTAFLSSQSNEVKCGGAPGVRQEEKELMEKANVWCVIESKYTGSMDAIDLDSQWILDAGLSNQE